VTLTASRPRLAEEEDAPRHRWEWPSGARRYAPVGAALVIAAGLFLRVWARSDLWLDEALTVNISRLPIGRIPGALRHDGAPPLYYMALHLWMSVFGTSDVAVRALSGLASGLTLPAVWLAAKRLGAPAAAWPAVVLLAANPFAVRYATENRMYALVALEAALGLLAVAAALERPTPGRLALVALAAAAVLYTHYWGLYVVAAAGLVTLVRALRRADPPESRRSAWRVTAALAAGGVLWLPWVPIFLFQARHTGTPWATPAAPSALIEVITQFSGGAADGPKFLALLLSVLLLLGLFGRRVDGGQVVLAVRGHAVAWQLLAVFLVTPALAMLAGLVTQSAFIGRYTSVVLPLFVVLCGLGVAALPDLRARVALLAAVSLLGLGISFHLAHIDRTEAGVLAGYLRAASRPGDVVGYCPDQLGPDTNRLLGDSLTQLTFPRLTGPKFVDWVDYQQVSDDASPAAFAQALVDRAGADHAVWLVTSSAYRTAARTCTEVQARLRSLRPDGHQVVAAKPGTYAENAALVAYPAAGTAVVDLPTRP
jgi:hypothetical protein